MVMMNCVGNVLGPSPVPTIVHCLARRDGTDRFYNLKVSLLNSSVCHRNVYEFQVLGLSVDCHSMSSTQ